MPILPLRWRLIKSTFSRALPTCRAGLSQPRQAKGERGIWQRRYWEHTLRNDGDLERHVNYIHYQSGEASAGNAGQDWPYSSFHRMVKLGIYPEDWAGDVADADGEFGERS